MTTTRCLAGALAAGLACLTLGCLEYKAAAPTFSLPKARENSGSDAKPADQSKAETPPLPDVPEHECMLPNDAWMTPFAQQTPIQFVSRSQNAGEWEKLPKFWNEGFTEKVRDPRTGKEVERKVVKIKTPLGLSNPPPVPEENPLTVAKFNLGKQLYFTPMLSSDGAVSCATCHEPGKGFTDQLKTSRGIAGQLGGMNAPTVMNSAYSLLQFWDGRASSLEHQAQGPVQNPVEMFDKSMGPPETHAWPNAVKRMRGDPDLVRQFKEVFGTEPTRDGAAKAIAAYERLVLIGNSLHDRAELLMRARVADEGKSDFTVQAKDYEAALKDAKAKKDENTLKALGLDAAAADEKLKAVAASIKNGHSLFFGKARCNSCHGGDNFTDHLFHNLGVGAKDGMLPADAAGRYGAMPVGHKNPEAYGAFKTPTLRGLLSTAPYMHDGSEATLEAVVEFYDRGGNANPALDAKMRDVEKEAAYANLGEARFKEANKDVAVAFCGPHRKPIIPLKLGMSAQEKADLVLFLKSLQGDPVDAVVAERPKQ